MTASTAELALDRANDAHSSASRANTRQDEHEKLCAERQLTILARMTRIENILITGIGSGVVGAATLIVTLLMKGH